MAAQRHQWCYPALTCAAQSKSAVQRQGSGFVRPSNVREREGSFVCAAARWPEVRFFGERVNPFNPKVETLNDETMYFDSIWGGRLTTQLELSAFDAVRDGLLLVLCDGRYASARKA